MDRYSKTRRNFSKIKQRTRNFLLDPGEVAICFGDDGTWCPLYKYDLVDGQIHQEFSDGEETVSSLSSDDDLLSLNENLQNFNLNQSTSQQTGRVESTNQSRSSTPEFNRLLNNQVPPLIDSDQSRSNFYSCSSISKDVNDQNYSLWPTPLTMSDTLLLYNQQEHF